MQRYRTDEGIHPGHSKWSNLSCLSLPVPPVAKPSIASFSPSSPASSEASAQPFLLVILWYVCVPSGHTAEPLGMSVTTAKLPPQLTPQSTYSSIPYLHISGIPIILFLSAILEMCLYSCDKTCGTLPHRGRQALWDYLTDTTFRQSSLGCVARTR